MKALSRVVIILVGLTFGSLLGYHAYKMKWMQVSSVELSLAPESHEEALFETIQGSISDKLSPWRGQWLWKANLRDIHQMVLSDQRVQTANVSRAFPNRIRISVVPHRAIFGLLDTKGRVHPISSDGTILPSVSTAEVLDYPLLRGLQFFDSHELRLEATELFKTLPEEGVFSQENLSEVRYSPREGFKLYLIKPEIQVLVGEAQLGPKTSRVEQVLRYLESRNVKGRIVDARMAGKVVVKVRE